MLAKDITRPESKLQTELVSEKCRIRRNSMLKAKHDQDLSRQVLKHEEETRANSGRSSARAKKT